jgi:hypothetical protein
MMQNLLNQSPYPLTIIGAGQGGAGFRACETDDFTIDDNQCIILDYDVGPFAAGYHSEFEPAPHWNYIYTEPPIY